MTVAETLANGTTIPQGSDPIHSSGVQAMRNLGGSVDGQLGNRYTKAQADALLAGKSPVGHGHQVSDVEGLDAALDAAGEPASWAQVTDKPTVFPPSAHTHALAQVDGLQAALDAKARKEPINLGAEDLDTIIDDGAYMQASSATASAALNYPANSNGLYTAGTLEVLSRVGDYIVVQRFTSYNGLDMFWRSRYAGTWGAWTRASRADELAPVQSRVSSLEYNTGWRDVTALLGEQYISGEYWIKRVRNTVYLHFYELKLVAGAGSSVRPTWNLPVGFRPSTRYANVPFAGKNATQYAAGPLRVSRYGVTDIYGFADGLMIDADVSFDTEDAPLAPANLPGAAATIF